MLQWKTYCNLYCFKQILVLQFSELVQQHRSYISCTNRGTRIKYELRTLSWQTSREGTC